jgi:prepilin-type N-terminal cleavage/methylation domain-containing protein
VSRTAKAQAAFTLVELLVVITLTLILAGAAVGTLSGATTWRTRAGVRRIEADVACARSYALLTGCRTLWAYTTSTATYELQQEQAPRTGAISATVINHPLTSAAWRVRVSDLGGLQISSFGSLGATSFGFGADGRPISTAGAVLSNNVDITFQNGTVLTIYAGSGVAEVTWQ